MAMVRLRPSRPGGFEQQVHLVAVERQNLACALKQLAVEARQLGADGDGAELAFVHGPHVGDRMGAGIGRGAFLRV